MPDKPTLREKIRDDAIGHTVWHFTGAKLLELAEHHWRAVVGALLASATASFWGYLKGLSRSYFLMAGMGTLVLVLFVWDMLLARQKPSSSGMAKSAGEPFVEKLGEIRFDYPGSPMDRWKFACGNSLNKALPVFAAPVDRLGGLTMTAPGTHHIDLKLEPHHRVCNRIKFEMKLTRDSEESYVYAKVQLTSKDNKTAPKQGWIACDVGNKPPAKHGPNEWIVYGKPSADGWTPFDLKLSEEVRKSYFGQEEGLEFSELLSIRLRGSVSVSALDLFRELPA